MILEVMEINDGFNDLARQFTLVEFGVSTMSLVVLKNPEGEDAVNNRMKGGEDT